MSEIEESVAAGGNEPQAPAPNLGLLLQKARESRGLTIDDVVQTLKFNPRQIEALEANDMAALPGSVFLRGIVRSYARFLKLDPEPLLALLATEAPAAPPDVRPPDNMGNAMPRGGLRQIPPLVALSVLLLIASATMLAWHFFGPKNGISLKSPEATVTEPAVATSAIESSPTTVVANLPAPVSSEALPSVSSTSKMPMTSTPINEASPSLPSDARPLSFRFRGKSWIEVKDAQQQIILTGQYPEGAQEKVAGRPPFQIVIGNAAQVDLVYGDQTVDLKPHTRAEVARLSLN